MEITDLPKSTANQFTGKGWAVYADTQYNVGSPLVVANTRTKITCNGLGASNSDQMPVGVAEFWDTVTSKMIPENIGDAYDIRVQFKGKCSSVSAHFDFELDIGAPNNIIFARTLSAVKGANTEVRYSVGVPVFSLATFVANGGEFYVDTTDDGTTLSLYDIQIFIKRDYASL
jgi:hypothetical protein